MAIDPVCGMEASEEKGLRLEKEGKIYFFCSQNCLDDFRGKDTDETVKVIISIVGMHCATCSLNIENALKKIPGVKTAKVNFASEQAFIEYEPTKVDIAKLHKAIEAIGYQTIREDSGESLDEESKIRVRQIRALKIRFLISLTFSLPLMYIAMSSAWKLPSPIAAAGYIVLLQFLLATPVIFCGRRFFTQGILAVFKSRMANMDTLVSLGVGSAYLYSIFVSVSIWKGSSHYAMHGLYYETAAFLITFILLGKYLEAVAKGKTSQAIKKLIQLKPKTAWVLRGTKEQEVRVEEIVIGDIVIIKPGQSLPVDGIVIEGNSSVDESMVTGESIPVEKFPGKEVIAGTINKTGTFRFEAIRVGKDTMLARIIKLVRQAQGSKAPIQELADRISAYFVPAVFMIAVCALTIWLILGQEFIFALSIFIAVLIIACPCALGLATPTAVMVGIGLAAENGILIKNASSLQLAHKINVVVFDKTGTLTRGKPRVADIISYAKTQDEILGLAASVEKNSEHPLAEAILEAAQERNISLKAVEDFLALPGKGVMARVEQDVVLLGNRKLMEKKNIEILSKIKEDAEKLEGQGKTVMFVVRNAKIAGLIAVGDSLKEYSRQALFSLKKLGKKLILLTGDNQKTAQALAKDLGLDQVLAEILPEDKAQEIKKLQVQGLKVAMVGDGINDAAALAQADIGIALGTGTDVAIESGDIVLVKDDLRDVVMAMDLSGYAMKKIKQNLFWAFFYNLIGIPIAAGILYPFTGFLLNPMIAGLAMAFSSVSVVGNSLLMRRYRIKTAVILIFCLLFFGCSRRQAADNPVRQPVERRHSLNTKDEQILRKDAELKRLQDLLAQKEALIKEKDAKIEELKNKLRSLGIF